MRSEYATWKAELERPRLTIAERVARWFDRPTETPEAAAPEEKPDEGPFVWRSIADLIPIEPDRAPR